MRFFQEKDSENLFLRMEIPEGYFSGLIIDDYEGDGEKFISDILPPENYGVVIDGRISWTSPFDRSNFINLLDEERYQIFVFWWGNQCFWYMDVSDFSSFIIASRDWWGQIQLTELNQFSAAYQQRAIRTYIGRVSGNFRGKGEDIARSMYFGRNLDDSYKYSGAH